MYIQPKLALVNSPDQSSASHCKQTEIGLVNAYFRVIVYIERTKVALVSSYIKVRLVNSNYRVIVCIYRPK